MERKTNRTSLCHSEGDLPWCCALPSGLVLDTEGDLRFDALSAQWPPAAQVDAALKWLEFHGCPNSKDLLDGHCEPLACYASSVACEQLRGLHTASKLDRVAATLVPTSVHGIAIERLKESGLPESMDAVFGFLRRHRWTKNVPPAGPPWNCPSSSQFKDFLFGTCEARSRIKAAAAAAQADGVIRSIPLYVLAYIFDNDELTDSELNMDHAPETAQYSCHVVGLVFEPFTRTVLIVDPNGDLLPGGNIEFVSMPPKHEPRRWTGTTRISCYDLDQQGPGRTCKRRNVKRTTWTTDSLLKAALSRTRCRLEVKTNFDHSQLSEFVAHASNATTTL